MDEKLKPGPKPAWSAQQMAQAYDLYFVQKLGRIKASKEMGIEPAQVVYLAHAHKKNLEAQ
jgi:hypothetical protein